nr:class I SAM-dependent methyltransferase [Tessaracoccus coleopterorum]
MLLTALGGKGRLPGIDADDVLDWGCGNGTISMWLAARVCACRPATSAGRRWPEPASRPRSTGWMWT